MQNPLFGILFDFSDDGIFQNIISKSNYIPML